MFSLNWDKVVDQFQKALNHLLGLHLITSLRLSCDIGHACVDMNSGFRSNVPFWGSCRDNCTMDIGQGSISGTAIKIMMPNHSNFPKTLLCQRRFWRNFGILAIQSLYNPAPGSFPAQPSPPAASPESADVEDSSQASESSVKAGRGYGKWRQKEEKPPVSSCGAINT